MQYGKKIYSILFPIAVVIVYYSCPGGDGAGGAAAYYDDDGDDICRILGSVNGSLESRDGRKICDAIGLFRLG